MKLLVYTAVTISLALGCNKRSQKSQDGASPAQTGDGNSLPTPNPMTPVPTTPGSDAPAPDTRPLAATVSTQAFSCAALDSGIYWFGKGDLAQKASATTRSSFFDPSKPTVIYAHGWQSGSHKLEKRGTFNYGKYDPIYGVKVDAADAWIDAGWNIGIFYWNQISDELLPNYAEDKVWGEAELTWKDCDGKAQAVPGSYASVVDLFFNEYTNAFKDYKGSNVRLAGHSLGNQLVTKLAEKLSEESAEGKVAANLVPKRIALIDPWWSAPTKTFSRAGTLKTAIQDLKSKGMIFEWYKTSAMTENNKSDENAALIPVIGRTEIFPDYYASINQMSRHMSAPFIYFMSFKDGAPKACATGSCTDLAASSATPDERMKELMEKAAQWQQIGGRETPVTSDNTFAPKSK